MSSTRSGVSAEQWIVALVAVAAPAALLMPVTAGLGWPAEAILMIAFVPLLPWTARRLPRRLAGGAASRPWLGAAWALTAILAIVQLARLSAFMTDSSRTWDAPVPEPLAIHHQCLSAYVQAADLSRRGEPNIYEARWYPAFATGRDAWWKGVSSPVSGLQQWLYDPYEYPPRPFCCCQEPPSR